MSTIQLCDVTIVLRIFFETNWHQNSKRLRGLIARSVFHLDFPEEGADRRQRHLSINGGGCLTTTNKLLIFAVITQNIVMQSRYYLCISIINILKNKLGEWFVFILRKSWEKRLLLEPPKKRVAIIALFKLLLICQKLIQTFKGVTPSNPLLCSHNCWVNKKCNMSSVHLWVLNWVL